MVQDCLILLAATVGAAALHTSTPIPTSRLQQLRHQQLKHQQLRHQQASISCGLNDDDSGGDPDIDFLALQGDAGAILAYGSVQAVFDVWQRQLPLFQTFETFEPVSHAPSQAIGIAMIWVGVTWLLRGYRLGATQALFTADGLVPLAVAWLGSSTAMLCTFVLLGSPGPLGTEASFVLGSAAAVGGWRYFYTSGLPLP